jgi:hypothetical protein
VNDVGVFAERKALPEGVFKRRSEFKPMNYHGLGEIGHQVHGVHRRQALSAERYSISYAQAILSLISNIFIFNKNIRFTCQCFVLVP